MLVDVNALVLPLGVFAQIANNSSSELRQIRFITRYLKKFLRMRVVERPYPISHRLRGPRLKAKKNKLELFLLAVVGLDLLLLLHGGLVALGRGMQRDRAVCVLVR
jgi:hypothetical protein